MMKLSRPAITANLVMLILGCLLLTACALPWPMLTATLAPAQDSPEHAVRELIMAMNSLDDTRVDARVVLENEDLLDEDIEISEVLELTYNELYVNAEANILDSDIIGDQAVVRAELSNLNVDQVFEAFSANLFDQVYYDRLFRLDSDPYETIDQIFLELLQAEDSRVTFSSDIRLTQVDGAWKVILDEILIQHLLGNYGNEIVQAYWDYDFYSSGSPTDDTGDLL